MPEQEKGIIKQSWKKGWDVLTTNKIKLSLLVLVLTIITFLAVSVVQTNSLENFINGIQIELFGIVFDVAILVLLFNWINSQGDKKRLIDKYREEIEDYRYWESDESKFRIRGIIKRLNKEAVTKIDLSFIDLSGNCKEDNKVNFSKINWNGSSLVQTNLSCLKMNNSNFDGTKRLYYTKFILTGLSKAKFRECHLQRVEFTEAYLHSADFSGSTICENTDFSGADISYAKFNDVEFGKAYFENAIVADDFFDKVRDWNIRGKNVFNDYRVVPCPYGNSFINYLQKKT